MVSSQIINLTKKDNKKWIKNYKGNWIEEKGDGITKEMQEKMLEVIREGLEKNKVNLNECATYIKLSLDSLYSGNWTVIINCEGGCYTYYDDQIVKLSYNGKQLIIWKSK